MNEGRIKFDCEWVEAAPVAEAKLGKLREWKKRLHGMGFIGEYRQGELRDVGFGNISIRDGDGFIITGAGTGGIAHLTSGHCVRVAAVDLGRNWVQCVGPIRASSESLTHAAIYDSDSNIAGVIHVHKLSLWRKLLRMKSPATSKEAPYGSPELAREIARLFRDADVRKNGIIALEGHEGGIVTFGQDLDQAGEALLRPRIAL